MDTSPVIAVNVFSVPRFQPRIVKTEAGILAMDCTPAAIDITSSEYTDEQFYADLKKASKRLDAMEKEALREHARGKTRKFPA